MLDEVRFCCAHIARTEQLVSCVMHFIVISKLSQAVFKAFSTHPRPPVIKRGIGESPRNEVEKRWEKRWEKHQWWSLKFCHV